MTVRARSDVRTLDVSVGQLWDVFDATVGWESMDVVSISIDERRNLKSFALSEGATHIPPNSAFHPISQIQHENAVTRRLSASDDDGGWLFADAA